MKKSLLVLFVTVLALSAAFAGGNGEKAGSEAKKKPLTWVWYPNESVPEKANARKAIIEVVSNALDRPIKEQLTTDYAIAIEALVNDNACFSWLGGEGYTQAHARNEAILPLVVKGPESGKLDEAKYYSMLGVLKGNADMYRSGGKYSIDNLVQKKFSFVSNSSTSGFRIPSSVISAYFAAKPEWKGLSSQDLLEGGPDKLFAEVMFGGSHQGSMHNMLTKKSDVSAFCNDCVSAYVEFVSGKIGDPRAGDLVRIKDGADEPFDKLVGTEFILISTTPVLEAPFVANMNLLTQEEFDTVVAALTSDETKANENIFPPKDSGIQSFGFKEGQMFLAVSDEWYDPIRELSGLK